MVAGDPPCFGDLSLDLFPVSHEDKDAALFSSGFFRKCETDSGGKPLSKIPRRPEDTRKLSNHVTLVGTSGFPEKGENFVFR